jgi:hypothetical protein
MKPSLFRATMFDRHSIFFIASFTHHLKIVLANHQNPHGAEQLAILESLEMVHSCRSLSCGANQIMLDS